MWRLDCRRHMPDVLFFVVDVWRVIDYTARHADKAGQALSLRQLAPMAEQLLFLGTPLTYGI